MRIKEIHIDRFGIFSDKKITGLGPGINVVYGPNEFGKTTLLEFIRRILFGFPSGRTRVNPYTPVAGGEVSGRLGCESASGEGFVISRVQGPYNGRITVSTNLLRRNTL